MCDSHNKVMSAKQSLVLDGDRGDFVEEFGGMEAKTAAALKSHSEAERRRRDRINTHLDTLRGLLPITDKMDKATLLAHVITELKQLKASARQASEEMDIPMDNDEVNVEKLEDRTNECILKASLCCQYRPDLLSNVKETMSDLPVKLLRSEISTLGDRMKIVFILTTTSIDSNTAHMHVLGCVRKALGEVLDKVSEAAELAKQLIYPRKRQRMS